MSFPFVQIICFTFLIPFYITCVSAQSNNGMVPPGTIISANETGKPWLSPLGDFAFGFQQIQGQDQYLLSVWYNRLPNQTLAWYLSEIDPVPKGSTVQLDAQIGLILRDPTGNTIWNTNVSVQKIDHGYMNDTGNFIVMSSSNETRAWQTFFLPADTILPLQGLVNTSVLISRKSYSSISIPLYYLVFQKNGDFTLSTQSPEANTVVDNGIYYNSNTSDPVNSNDSAYVLFFHQKGYLYVIRNNNRITDISPISVPSALENFYKATINTDGVFALSYHPRNFTVSPGWTDVWNVPANKSLSVNGGDVCKVVYRKGHSLTVSKALLGSSVFMNILLSCAIACLVFYSISGNKKEKSNSSGTVTGKNTRVFTYKELEEATNGFKDEAGRGSFGIVYCGMLPSGSKAAIAVKKLDRVAIDAEKEFRAEVNTIGQTHHKNLVHLIGFCDEGQHRLLVYEYMINGTLASLIFGDSKPSWNLRTQIAIGISRAITYLHEECYTQIIHCDIKPQNILLDENYNARICDFGLAKLLVLNQSRTLTNIRGTKGYVAPEWFRNSSVTAKVDVYSFGVMLLEIICCKRNIEDIGIGEENVIILVDWVWDCFQDKKLDVLIEGDLEALDDWNTMKRFVKVGIWCIQEDPNLRPTMRKVSLMLDGVMEVSLPPCPYPSNSSTGDQ